MTAGIDDLGRVDRDVQAYLASRRRAGLPDRISNPALLTRFVRCLAAGPVAVPGPRAA